VDFMGAGDVGHEVDGSTGGRVGVGCRMHGCR
jgi:hypothetical protein